MTEFTKVEGGNLRCCGVDAAEAHRPDIDIRCFVCPKCGAVAIVQANLTTMRAIARSERTREGGN